MPSPKPCTIGQAPFVGIEGLVCQQGLGRHIRQQRVGAFGYFSKM
jgi:hypothetical protein